jgi:ATP-dependent metalloprotease
MFTRSLFRSPITTKFHSSMRCFSLGRNKKLERMEVEANLPTNARDARRQADLLKEMLKTSPTEILQRFERQPQLNQLPWESPTHRNVEMLKLQSDVEACKTYLTAMGVGDSKVVERVAQMMSAAIKTAIEQIERSPISFNPGSAGNPQSFSYPHYQQNYQHSYQHNHQPNYQQNYQPQQNAFQEVNNTELLQSAVASALAGQANGQKMQVKAKGDNKGYWVQTPLNQWQSALNKSQDPINIVVSEAWTWGGLTRKLAWMMLTFVLTMTGLSLLLDHQGMRSGTGSMTPKEVEPSQATIRFADVQGCDEAKQELEEIVQFLKEPRRFIDVGGKLPKGILLYGPPGTGKTHLARAVAGEAGVPFFHVSGSEFDELYVGVGARRVRELFAAAKLKAPCIVFIDELDAVGSKRSARDQSYMRQTLNQLLVELDGFSSSEGVILIGATNTPESLDKALVRPGRFDRHVPVPLPDIKGRSHILQVHMKGINVAEGVEVETVARGTPGFSGADLANLVNQAALRASKEKRTSITLADLEWSKDKIIMGAERKSAIITDESKRVTAYHEGGHALVALHTPGAMPLHKVTVIPRGQALGVTVQLPEQDQNSYSKKELLAMMDVCMGGRVAEELILGKEDITTGASNDLEKATDVARGMVMVYGMSDKIGPVSLAGEREDSNKMSPEGRQVVEKEIRDMLEVLLRSSWRLTR